MSTAVQSRYVTMLKDDFDDGCKAAIVQLALIYQHFREPPYRSDIDHKFQACFIDTLRHANIEPVSRSYRAFWTSNYQLHLGAGTGCEELLYSSEVMAAAVDNLQPLGLNGKVHRFSKVGHRLARDFRKALLTLDDMLHFSLSDVFPKRHTWRVALTQLDTCWAGFEDIYIRELIQIEELARQPLQEASELERALSLLEGVAPEIAIRGAREALMSAVARLNVIANPLQQLRKDLSGDLLGIALAVIRGTNRGTSDRNNLKGSQPVLVLAQRVLDSFASIRAYLCALDGKMDTIDPVLCNNPGLAECLQGLEACWEIGGKYLVHTAGYNSLCSTVRRVDALCKKSRRFAELCESCDAELFFILPRVFLIEFLLDQQAHREVMQRCLPAKFLHNGDLSCDVAHLLDMLHRVRASVGSTDETWNLLQVAVVSGPSWQPSTIDGHDDFLSVEFLSEFVRKLEGLSMELQRTSPQEWNQCSEVVINCYTLTKHW